MRYRFYGGDGVVTSQFTPTETEFRKKIADIVRKREDKSATVCGKCGEEGYIRKELPWKATLCDSCYEKRIAVSPREKARQVYDAIKAKENNK